MCNRCRRARFYFNALQPRTRCNFSMQYHFCAMKEIFNEFIRTRVDSSVILFNKVLIKLYRFFLYKIVFFVSSINDIQIRYFIFVTALFYRIFCACKVVNEDTKFILYRKETLFSRDRSKLSRVSRENNMSHRINVRIARAKLMARL